MSDQLETISDYYKKVKDGKVTIFETDDFVAGTSHFNITMRKYCSSRSPYSRRDYYRVSLIIGKGKFQYGNQTITIESPSLFFPSLNIPYSWECEDVIQEGYTCLFNQEFFSGNSELQFFKKTSLFKEWSSPLVVLTEEQTELATLYFDQIYRINNSSYPFRCNSIKSNLVSVLHLALENRMEDISMNNLPANVRLYRMFDELLNKQFPLDSPTYPLELKTASDFADHLHVHVNHLNSSVKSVTNLTTTQIIKERILEESKNLLKYTNWDIAEVGYTLGFEQPSHFNNFFKKHTDHSPLQFRKTLII